MGSKLLNVSATLKKYDIDGKQGEYVELITNLQGIDVKLYVKDNTAKELLKKYLKEVK